MITDAAAGGGDSDQVEITTVGIDVGSATFHLSFSRVLLRRRAQELSTRYEVAARDILWSSPVAFTPYCDADDTIDASAVAAAVTQYYQRAGIATSEIDSGAVLLTGTALARHNARALAGHLAAGSGRFVCAAAGPHLEAILAAHGSGAAETSIAGPPVVAVDVGGGTTKLALAVDGQIRATAALAVGARLVAWDLAGRLTRVERSVVPAAEQEGVRLTLGGTLAAAPAGRLCERLARAVVGQILPDGRRRGEAAPGAGLLLTGPFPAPASPFVIMVSGGVAEYLDDPGHAGGHGDLGPQLARALSDQLAAAGLEPMRRPARQRIRATVIGAAQFSTQVSGSTIRIGNEKALPLHNVPVLRPALELGAEVDAREVAEAVRRAAAERPEALIPGRPVAVAVGWQGLPEYRRLRAFAEGVAAASRDALAGAAPLVIAVDRDLAASLGRIMVEEAGMDGQALLCLDNLDVGDLDHLDVGRPSVPAHVVPVVVKSLLFSPREEEPAHAHL